MTEVCFNDLTARLGVATVAVEVKGLVLDLTTLTTVLGNSWNQWCVAWTWLVNL